MEPIKLFMWGFQRHFQISVQGTAEKLFHSLDPNFEIETFLVGLMRTESPNDHPVCLEPEECGFEPHAFASVRKDAAHYLAVDSERNLMAMHESSQRAIDGRRLARADRNAVLKAISERHRGRPEEYSFSGFMPVANYDVGIVLRLTHRQGVTHYHLPRSNADERHQVPTSLVQSAADIFLRRCCKSLYVPHPEGVADWDGPPIDELLRKAGDRLMEAPCFASGGVEGLYLLFDTCNYIASLTYESAASFGEMLIARQGHPNIQPTITLAKPIRLNEHRAIRKLLEISSTGDAILSDGSFAFGFGRFCGRYDQAQSDLFRVRFIGHHKWELHHADHKLMRVIFGKPSLALSSLDEASFVADAERVFKGISPEAVAKLFALSGEACQQRHGTVLVITPEAASETKRLSSQAIGIVPVSLTPETLRSVTAIDGAVILDTGGTCYGIGVILDGEAVDFGNSGRGARYNSSLRYWAQMQTRGTPCIVIIVSEDGTAEWIPQLLPRLPRHELEAKEAEADTILGLMEFPISRASRLLDWLSGHRFYLSQSLCEKANRIETKRSNALSGLNAFFLPYKAFGPDAAMSADFLEE